MQTTTFDDGPRRPSLPTTEPEPRCPCGHDRHHYMVSADGSYGLGGLLRLFVGISTRPTKVTYRCRRCETVIAETTSPETLDRFY